MQLPRIDHKYHTVISNRDVKKYYCIELKIQSTTLMTIMMLHHQVSVYIHQRNILGGGAGMGTETVFDFHIQPQ